jgi:tripartite-type tricarboxylate transporter receptor subunit TctC
MKRNDPTSSENASVDTDDRALSGASDSTVDTGRRTFLSGAGALGAAAALPLVIAPRWARAEKFPDRAITAVVMYAAGGGTDVVLRALAGEMAKSVSWDVNVINKPGGVGAVATSFVLGKPSDGYWWLGAANYNKFVRVMGGSDSRAWVDWQFYQAANSLASWSVRPESPFKSFPELVEYAKKNPGKLSISTSGTGGIWHELAAIVAQAAGIKIRYVPYKGGKPATLAGLQGETDIAGGGVHEHIEFIRAGKLRCLQQTGTKDINVDVAGRRELQHRPAARYAGGDPQGGREGLRGRREVSGLPGGREEALLRHRHPHGRSRGSAGRAAGSPHRCDLCGGQGAARQDAQVRCGARPADAGRVRQMVAAEGLQAAHGLR